jgi:hypothetical protein
MHASSSSCVLRRRPVANLRLRALLWWFWSDILIQYLDARKGVRNSVCDGDSPRKPFMALYDRKKATSAEPPSGFARQRT